MNSLSSYLGLLGGASYTSLCSVVLITALILKIFKPEQIGNKGALNTAVILAIISFALPSLTTLAITTGGSFRSSSTFLATFIKLLSVGNIALLIFAIHNLWTSIKTPRRGEYDMENQHRY